MHKANAIEAAKRAIATFVAGATATPISAAVFDISFIKAAAVAGFVALWNFAGRWAQFELQSKDG